MRGSARRAARRCIRLPHIRIGLFQARPHDLIVHPPDQVLPGPLLPFAPAQDGRNRFDLFRAEMILEQQRDFPQHFRARAISFKSG